MVAGCFSELIDLIEITPVVMHRVKLKRMSGLSTTTKSITVGEEEIVGISLGGHWTCIVLRNRSIAFDCGTLFDAAVSYQKNTTNKQIQFV